MAADTPAATPRLANKVALVTGGSSGIGRAAAVEFGRAGAQVAVASRREPEGTETASLIEDAGGNATFVRTDVTDEDQVSEMVEHAIETFGWLDYAFNNAGSEGRPGPLTDLTEADWDAAIDTNLKGAWLSMKHELPHVRERSGAIVNNASNLGHVGTKDFAAYVAAKHGVIGLTRAAAVEYASDGVRVNAVSPGAIGTPMAERVFGSVEGQAEVMEPLHPLGRIGDPEEVAAAVVWLCSPGASFVTGHSLLVDGGYNAQ